MHRQHTDICMRRRHKRHSFTSISNKIEIIVHHWLHWIKATFNNEKNALFGLATNKNVCARTQSTICARCLCVRCIYSMWFDDDAQRNYSAECKSYLRRRERNKILIEPMNNARKVHSSQSRLVINWLRFSLHSSVSRCLQWNAFFMCIAVLCHE